MPERFTTVKRGGYSIQEVDDYIQTLEQVVKSYKEKDAAIKNAILNAQLAADNIVKNAQLQADEVRRQVMRKLDGITNSIGTQKSMLKQFQDDYNSLIQKYIVEYNEKDIEKAYGKINDLEEFIAKFSNTSSYQEQEQDGNLDMGNEKIFDQENE